MAAEIASLSFSVDSSPIAAASSALNQMQQASTGVVTRVGQLQSSVAALVAALDRNTASANALTAKMDAVQLSAAKTAVVVKGVGDAANDSTPKVDRLGTSTEKLKPAFDNAAAAAARLKSAWADLGNQGAATLLNMERMAKLAESSANKPSPGWLNAGRLGAAQSYAVTPVGRLSNLSSDGSVPGMPRQAAGAANQNRPAGGGLAGYQLQNLAYQGGDIVSQLGSGANLSQIAFQQGPQIAQIFGGAGGASVKGALSQGADAASALASRIGVVTGAFGLAAVAIAATAYALSSYTSQQKELQLSVSGRGRASGASVGDINRVAVAGAQGAGVSVGSARDMVADYADTGRIGTAMYGGLLKAAQDYAVTTRQELPDANKALAASFADIGKGVDVLNGQLNAFSAEQVEAIKRMDASGDRLGAQKMALDLLGTSLLSARDRLGFFGKQWLDFKNTTGGEIDAIGRTIDRVFSGGDLETQITTAKTRLDAFKSIASYLPLGIGTRDVEISQKAYDELLAKQKALQDGSRTADLNQRSQAVDRLVRAANPQNENLKQLEDNAKRIRTELAAGVLDPSGESLRTAQGLEASAKRIREDLASGGSELAASLRNAQFESKQVGSVGLGRSVAEINQQFDERKRNYSGDEANRATFEKGLEEERAIRVSTAQRTATLAENAVGAAFSRMPDAVQQQMRSASVKYPNVPVGVLAGIAGPESGGNVNVGYSKSLGENGKPSSAYGLGQITKGTAEEAVRLGYLPQGYDRTNTATMADGIAGVLSMKIAQNGGDLTRGIMAYRGSNDPEVNRKYAADVLRNSGQLGDQSATSMVKDTDSRARALETERKAVVINTQFLGVNGEAFDAATRKAQLLADAQARGIPITADLEAEFDKLSKGGAAAARSLAGTRAGRDLDFENDQLGRDRYDQAAYSRARGVYGDTSTPDAQAYIGRSRENAQLQDVRSTLTDTGSSFVQALSKGTSAAAAFSQALSRIGDKLISGAFDSLVGSAFGGRSSAGGIGGFFSSLLGGSSSGAAQTPGLPNLSFSPFALGGIMTNQGPVQLRKYAKGGIANEPQIAMYGEAGPEAYVPLPDGRRIPVAMSGPAANGNVLAGGANGNTFAPIFNVNAQGSTMSKQEYVDLTTGVLQQYDAQQRKTQYARSVVDRKGFG